MKKNLVLFISILLTQICTLAQSNVDAPILIKTFFKETTLDPVQELALRISNYRASLNGKETRVVIRLCTAEPMRVAVLRSAWLFPTILQVFKSSGLNDKDIVVLKSVDCLPSASNSVIATEIWLAKNDGILPSSSEKYLASQIIIKEISQSDWYGGNADYLGNTKRLIEALRNDKSSFGVIQGYYIKKSYENRMKNKLKQISGLIKTSGLLPPSYNIELIRTTNWLDMGEPKYPVFYVVRIQ